MKDALKELEGAIASALPQLLSLSEAESLEPRTPGKWSRKEILGHLIDSAGNNHQRFVRLQLSSEVRLQGYEQEAWVKAQGYQNESWENLVRLWQAFNLHLHHVGAGIPTDRLKNLCYLGDKEPVTLEFLFRDYVRHVKHHLAQILG